MRAWVGLTLLLVVPLSAWLCREFGRNGWAHGQDNGTPTSKSRFARRCATLYSKSRGISRIASILPVLLRWIIDCGLLHVGLRRDGVGVVDGPGAVGRAVHDLEERLAILASALVEGDLSLGYDVRRVEAARSHLARQHRMLWREERGLQVRLTSHGCHNLVKLFSCGTWMHLALG